jgi:hypothetical protein
MKQTVMAVAALLACAAPTPAQRGGLAPPQPVPLRAVFSEVVVVGTLGKAEEKTIPATVFLGAKAKAEYRVLELKVEEGLRGAKKGDVLRFGFLVPRPDRNGRVPRPDTPEAVTYRTGQGCLFFLRKHHDEGFYTPLEYGLPIDQKGKSYAADLKLTRRCLKLWADPKAGLRAKVAEDRLLTAGLLIHVYRHYQAGKYGLETEEIPAEECKLILRALAEADWEAKVRPGGSVEMTPRWLFFRLEIGFKDGWGPATGVDEINRSARKWVQDHADTYRIRRYAPVPAGKVPKGK